MAALVGVMQPVATPWLVRLCSVIQPLINNLFCGCYMNCGFLVVMCLLLLFDNLASIYVTALIYTDTDLDNVSCCHSCIIIIIIIIIYMLFSGCLQLLEISWNLLDLLKIFV